MKDLHVEIKNQKFSLHLNIAKLLNKSLDNSSAHCKICTIKTN